MVDKKPKDFSPLSSLNNFGDTEVCSDVKDLDIVQISPKRSSIGGPFSPRDCHDGCVIDGLGAVCQGRPAHGTWTEAQRGWHINRLELLAVFLALQHFSRLLNGRHVLVRMDNTTVVSYLNHQGGLRSRTLCRLARNVLLWTQNRFLTIRAVHVSGHLNFGADMLSRQSLEEGEWRLHPQMVSCIWRVFGEVEVDLFASSTTTHCTVWFSLSPRRPWDWTL